MTKRYNMFNYIETWAGIILILINIPVVYFAFIICKRYDFDLLSIVIAVVCIIVLSVSTIRNGIKLIREGQHKAFTCDDKYIYGRVRACEFDTDYMIHNLDCIKALEYCHKDDCVHCPFRISCKQTNCTWMIHGSRSLLKRFFPTNTRAKELSAIIDRYRNCDEEYCTYEDCQFYDQCLISQEDYIRNQLYELFSKHHITSADLLRR